MVYFKKKTISIIVKSSAIFLLKTVRSETTPFKLQMTFNSSKATKEPR
jgi:hypothetical protein